MKTTGTVITLGLVMATAYLHADNFGSGVNAFTIDFVTVGNAGNSDDAGAGGGSYSSPYGGVGYDYRMGAFEISQDQITKATNSGLANVTAGAWTGSMPAANISWYEAAAFVNWLNLQAGAHAAYDLTYSSGWSMTLWGASEQATTGVDSGTNGYRHKDAYYFLPSEDEWYKAAYHKNDGESANYWDYATASNTAPTPVASGTGVDTAVYNNPAGAPAGVDNNGGESPYGTRGQNGNVWEWSEGSYDGLNSSPTASRASRGGAFYSSVSGVNAPSRSLQAPSLQDYRYGFRVASVPEPSAALLVLTGLGVWVFRRRRVVDGKNDPGFRHPEALEKH